MLGNTVYPMSPSEAAFEGQDLEESLAKACQDLGVEPDELDYRLDREHFLNGASTVRIYAAKKDPLNGEIKERLEGFLAEEFDNRGIEASANVKVTNQAATVVIEAPSGVVPDDDEALATLSDVLRDLVGEPLGERAIDVSVRPPMSPEPPSRGRDRDDRRDRRGGRDRDRDRGRGRDRDRDRGRGRDRDRDRGRGRDRDRDGDRRPERDPKRDAELQSRAREAAEQVQDDGEPVTIEELNSYERRIVHRVVAEYEGVTTRSVGRGSLKAVRILEGEDEED